MCAELKLLQDNDHLAKNNFKNKAKYFLSNHWDIWELKNNILNRERNSIGEGVYSMTPPLTYLRWL